MPLIDPENGYNRYATNYRKDYDHLDSFDWNCCQTTLWEILKTRKNVSLLDAGCGDGRVLVRLIRKFPDTQLWGWDISEKMLAVASRRTKGIVKLVKHDVCLDPPAFSYPSEGFDVIVALFLLVHIQTPSLFFLNIRKVIKQEGVLVLNTIPQRRAPKLFDKKGDFTIEYYNHPVEKIQRDADNQGFSIHSIEELEHSAVIVLKNSHVNKS